MKREEGEEKTNDVDANEKVFNVSYFWSIFFTVANKSNEPRKNFSRGTVASGPRRLLEVNEETQSGQTERQYKWPRQPQNEHIDSINTHTHRYNTCCTHVICIIRR